MKGTLERQNSRGEKLCDEVKTIKKFTFQVDKVNAGGGCETVVTERTRGGWVKFKEC